MRINNDKDLEVMKELVKTVNLRLEEVYMTIEFHHRKINEWKEAVEEYEKAIREYELENGEGDRLADEARDMEIQRSL